ncbi:MAG: diguanylate cyclase [Sporomusaceae bacterium]|nr:diguanylate cyclase [Sporomusaceae bacterium]
MANLYVRKISIFFSLIVLVLLLGSASSTYDKDQSSQVGPFIFNFDILEDKNAEEDIQTVSDPQNVSQFRYYSKNAISQGISPSIYWVRFVLPNNNLTGEKRFLEFISPNFSKIDIYFPTGIVNGTTQYTVKKVGTFRPTRNNDVLNNTWTIAVPTEYMTGQFVYLRLDTVSAFRLPVRIWDEKDFLAQALIKHLSYGIFFGIIIAAFLYNFLALYILKDKAYFFYVFYVAASFIYQLAACGYLRLLLDLSYPMYRGIFWASLSIAFMCSVFFTGFFLRVRRGEMIWFRLLGSFVVIALLGGVLGVLGYELSANRIAYGLGMTLSVAFMILAFIRFRQGYQPARFYLLAWGVLAVGVFIWTILPYRLFGVNGLLVSSVVEMLLLSLALSERFKQLRLRELMLTKHIDYYKDLSDIDELTGLYNRRGLNRVIQKAIKTAAQENRNLSIMVLDIDFFKNYNDNYGHWQGDQVLVSLGNLLLNNLEVAKMAFRYGGEEFVVLVTDIQQAEVMRIAEQIRQDFAKMEFMPIHQQKVSVTLSIGVTAFMPSDSMASLFERADKALYDAKAQGRNQVVQL